MSNLHRGEICVALGGVEMPLRLSLQALAEIEAAFGADDLVALGQRLSQGRLSAKDIITLLGAVVRGGGNRLDDATLAQRIGGDELGPAMEAIARLFLLSFGGVPPAPPPMPQEA